MTSTGAGGIAERIEETRRHAGLSRLALSDRAGIPYPTLRRKLEHTPQFFNVDELVRIAEALDTDIAYLASGKAVTAA